MICLSLINYFLIFNTCLEYYLVSFKYMHTASLTAGTTVSFIQMVYPCLSAVWHVYRPSSSHLITYAFDTKQCVPRGMLTNPKAFAWSNCEHHHHLPTFTGKCHSVAFMSCAFMPSLWDTGFHEPTCNFPQPKQQFSQDCRDRNIFHMCKSRMEMCLVNKCNILDRKSVV